MKTEPAQAIRLKEGHREPSIERVVIEAPLQIAINEVPFTVTMRTPGEDRLLARGLLAGEGIISDPGAAIVWRETREMMGEMMRDRMSETEGGTRGGIRGIVTGINAAIAPGLIARDFSGDRSMLSASSCGLCGRREWAGEDAPEPLPPAPLALPIGVILAVMEKMRAGQRAFSESGGCHAAAAFTEAGELLGIFEDVGRHNAVDKVVGWLAENGALGRAAGLAVSGRVSYEITQKAAAARIPILAAVSAPSSLAIGFALRAGITLAGFCRENRATIYTHPENIC